MPDVKRSFNRESQGKMEMTGVLRLISGLMLLVSIGPSEAVTCYNCTYDPAAAHTHLFSSCRLPLGPRDAGPTCDGQFCQSILFTSSEQSVPTIYRSCINLSPNITVEKCSQYSRVLGIAFFLFENLCCYSVANTAGTYTHCFCQDDFCNYKVTHPVLDARSNTTTSRSFQLAALTLSPDRAEEQRQSVTCYNCTYSVNAGATEGGESTCSEPFNSTGISTCSAKGCYTYAYVAEEQYIVKRACDANGNFEFHSDEECRNHSQANNTTFFIHENQCCYTIYGRWAAFTVCYCYSDLCNSNVSRPVLAPDALTTTSKPVTFNISTFLPAVGRNSTQVDQLSTIFSSKRYTPPFSRKTTAEPTKRPSKPTQLRPLNNTRQTTPNTGSKTTFAPLTSSITCYNCSYFPNSESANDSVCSGHSGPAAAATCTGRACYFYAYTSDQGTSEIYRACDKKGTIVFQSEEQCLQYGTVYSLTFFAFENQCCYITDAFGVPVTVCFCNTELCNSNRLRPMPQTATTQLTAATSNPIPDILPSFPYNTTIVTPLASEVNSTSAATLSTSLVTPSGSGLNVTSASLYNASIIIPSVSGVNATSTAGSMPSVITSESLETSTVTQSSSEISSTQTPAYVSPTQSSPSSASLSSTQKTSSLLSTTTTFNRSVRCYNCTYFPNSDLTGTSMCTDPTGSTSLSTCSGRSCYTYTYISQQGVLVIFRACDKEGTLEFQSDEQCLQYSQVHHLTFFTFEHQCCYVTDVSGRPVTVCFCNNDLCNANRSRPTKKR